jgi:enterochelin esterase family protein
VARLTISSDRLGRDRRIDVYRPAGFDPAAPDTVLLILFDGPAYQRDLAPVPLILDRLIAAGRLPPVVALLIDPIDNDQRGRDLTCNPDFTDALADELVPQIAARLGLAPDRARTVIAGSSYGGLASAFAVRRRPEVFGNAVVLSGSFWWAPEGEEGQGMPYMSSLWAEGPLPDVRLWMSAGTYEAGREPGAVSILETTRHLRDVLRIRGADVTYRQYSGGHDYLVWRGALAEGLLHLFGRE